MKKVLLSVIIGITVLMNSSFITAQEKANYKIIVNTANPVSSLTKIQIARLFLKKQTYWSNGIKVAPVDQLPQRDVRDSFSKNILKKSVSSVKSYWQQQIFSGRANPPVEKSSDLEVINFVKNNRGAIGYVSKNAKTPPNVKVIIVK